MNYFDLHCDTIGECANRKLMLFDNELSVSLDKGTGIENWVQVYAVWIPDEYRGDKAYNYFLRIYDYFINQIELNGNYIKLCLTADDIDEALSQNKCAAILSIEGGAAIMGELEKLHEAYNLGVRLMTLTWNGSNELGDGIFAENAGGLTEFGFSAIDEMAKLGMIIDVSHLSDRGFWDVHNSNNSYIASHSNSKKICGFKRNLTDEQISAIVIRNGIIGINFCCDFLANNNNHSPIIDGRAHIYDHINHFIKLGAAKNLAFGCDFDGADVPDNLNDVSKMNILYDYLLENGLDRKTVDDIFFNNALNYFKKALK